MTVLWDKWGRALAGVADVTTMPLRADSDYRATVLALYEYNST